MLGHRIVTKQTAASGALCTQMMVCERRYNRRETYLALLLNRSIGGLAVMASPQGTVTFLSHSSLSVLCLQVILKARDSLTRLIGLPSTCTRDSPLIVIDLISSVTLTERRAGGVDIEEVARDNPTALITESVDHHRGLYRDQALRIVNAIGFSPAVHNSVLLYISLVRCTILILLYIAQTWRTISWRTCTNKFVHSSYL